MEGLKRFIFGLTAAVLGIAIALAVAEAGLRIADYSSPQFYQADEALGYKLIPNSSGWYTKEGRSLVEINSDGFRDAERTIEKPSGVFRIAVIGDSYVEALQVEREAAFTSFIARDCDVRGVGKVEVLSFGVSGYGTAQQLILLREKVLRYSPDVVMLVMTTNNDISDNVRELKRTPIPYYVIRDGALVLDESFRSDSAFMVRNSFLAHLGIWFEHNLRFVQATREIIRNFRNRRSVSRVEAADGAASAVIEVGVDSQVYREPADEVWRRAWHVTEALIAEMNREVEARGARFVVATASNGVQVLPERAERDRFAKLLGVDDLFYPDRRISEFCAANSIPSITLATVLAEYAAREQVHLHGVDGNLGYGHWNRLGHKVAGEAIAERLCRIVK